MRRKAALLFHSIPPLSGPENGEIRAKIERIKPQRVVYISSTGVYGAATEVGAETPAAPSEERGRQRLREEQWIASGDWSSLILRAAAIYGPGRGVHRAIREGRVARGSSAQVVSRIHVDDLAALAEAGLLCDASGAWPVADELPCASAEIAAWLTTPARLAGNSDWGERIYRVRPESGRKRNSKTPRSTTHVRNVGSRHSCQPGGREIFS